jgi:hypothetical protein
MARIFLLKYELKLLEKLLSRRGKVRGSVDAELLAL